jgi:tetratricopeptide (TPR) repeat protein
MSKTLVTEQEIQAAIDLSAQRDFITAVALYQGMLPRAKSTLDRMKILFGIITSSTWLKLEDIRENAIQELKQFPDYEVSHAFVVTTQAAAYIDFGHAQEALDLIDVNLSSDVLHRDDFRNWKYEHLFLKGRSLVLLARYDEALCVFDSAHDIEPNGKFETLMLIERSNCFIAFGRYSEAYDTVSRVLSRGDEEMATLAMLYMAECRMWQSRVPEAVEIYAAIQKRMPCRLVEKERIQTGIKNAMTYLEKRHPQGKSS